MSPTDAWIGVQPRRQPDMPSVLCFDKNSENTVAALHQMGTRMRVPMRGTRLNQPHSRHRRGRIRSIPPFRSFETIKEISPAAALVLAAEFERVWQLGGSKPFVANIHRWDKKVVETLWEIGFFDIVGFPTSTPEPSSAGDEIVVRMRSGKTADPASIAELTSHLQALFPGEAQGSADGLVHMYGALIEAIVNVVRHAYPRQGSFWGRPSRMWWMTGAVDRRVRWTTAVVYDQGVTIPVTLPDWHRYGGFIERIAASVGIAPLPSDTRYDGRVIEVAMEESLSSTGEAHRGNGLAQMRNFVDHCHAGHLRILSRCGEVVFRPGSKPDVKTHDVSIAGTLIEWRVLL
jgi:hypothetical protein